MSASVQLELLLSITSDCLSLLSEGQVEEYLSLEGERRHLLDSLPGDFPAACKPQLEQLQARSRPSRTRSEQRVRVDELRERADNDGDVASG